MFFFLCVKHEMYILKKKKFKNAVFIPGILIKNFLSPTQKECEIKFLLFFKTFALTLSKQFIFLNFPKTDHDQLFNNSRRNSLFSGYYFFF